MVQYIPPPDPRSLLPSLLACLPTAFVSTRPPPALLPLLSPILRQRVQILSGDSSSSDSWLPLLCWDQNHASKLPAIIERLQLEPHPISGEVELPDVQEIEYRRRDQETLHARIQLEGVDILPIYLWCMSDASNGTGSGWKLAELKTRDDAEDGSLWHKSITEAEERAQEGYVREALSAANASAAAAASTAAVQNDTSKDDDDDAYWAAYDRTPGRTPARTPAKRSPVHNSNLTMPSTSELEYFARYLTEVQPAMDPHDPDEDGLAPGESTLHGNELSRALETHQEPNNINKPETPVENTALPPVLTNGVSHDEEPERQRVHSPRPRSPASSTRSIEHLEQAAQNQSQAEIGIKQHISTDIKSLFRLARSAGIERQEFERIVSTELQMLEMMDMDE